MTADGARAVLELESVTFRYDAGLLRLRQQGTDVLKGITFSLRAGETLGVVGESGSGKSTLARLSLGLHHPTSGTLLFDGTPHARLSRRKLRGQSQVVLQTPHWSLNPRLHCGTSVAEPLVIERVGTRATRRQRVDQLLEQVGLPAEVADRYPHELSGGQQQRVAIARSLATNPRLLVLDEVVSALDVSVQAQILNLLKELQIRQGFTAIFISHDLAVVRYLAHRIAVLYDGAIVEMATSEAFYGRAGHPYSRALQQAHSPEADSRFRLREGADIPETGCPLAPRCPLAVDRCRAETPLLRPVGKSEIACHRAEEVLEIAS